LLDTEKIVDYFYDTCFEAGVKCPLVKSTDIKASDVRNRVDAFIQNTTMSPIYLVQGNEVITITGDDLHAAFHRPLYDTVNLFQPLAQQLADAMVGNYTALLGEIPLPKLHDACPIRNDTWGLDQGGDAAAAVLCSDGESLSTRDVEYFTEYIRKLKAQSPTIGEHWGDIVFSCAGWRVRPKWRFEGPFRTPQADPSVREGVPAAPLLFLSSRLDPVTPLENAYRMSASHPGSAVVEQDSVGHCAVASGWSECTNKILRDYFDHGIVPKNGTRCESKCHPWNKEECGLPMEDTDFHAMVFGRPRRRSRRVGPPQI
jgi:hypothetical protein